MGSLSLSLSLSLSRFSCSSLDDLSLGLFFFFFDHDVSFSLSLCLRLCVCLFLSLSLSLSLFCPRAGSASIEGTVMASAPNKVKNTTSEDEEEYFEPSKSFISPSDSSCGSSFL